MQQDIDDNNEENIVANMSAIDTALACRKQVTNNIDELLSLALFHPLMYALSKHQTTSIANHRYVVPRDEFR